MSERGERDGPERQGPAERGAGEPGAGERGPEQHGPEGQRSGQGGPEGEGGRPLPSPLRTWQSAAGFYDATGGERSIPGAEVRAHEDALPEPGEHDFEPDVERIHRPIYREPRDPREGHEPAPWWVWVASVLAIFWGGWYLGRHGGTFDLATHTAFVQPGAAAAGAEEQGAVADPMVVGERIYNAQCRACHQAEGAGLPGTFPPLAHSEWVTGSPETLIRILLHGVQGPIEVAGAHYQGVMPAFQAMLSDAEVAAIATYVRHWDLPQEEPISPALVERLRQADAGRAQPWTADELRAAEGGAP